MPILVLDPGHGGRDSGAVGKQVREKDVNLQVCLLLRDALTRSGVNVLMTREKDTERVPGVTEAIDLKARAMLANTNSAELFVSWHYDASNDPRVHGTAVWIHPSQKDKAAYHKAGLLSHHIATASGQKNRGVYLGDFQVLRDTMMDALLVEGGFLTNAGEEAGLLDPAFLRKQAEGAAKALCQMLGVPYIKPYAPKFSDVGTTAATRQVTVQVDGEVLEQHGQLIDGHTYIPVRAIAERLGCKVEWDGSSQTVSLTRGA